MRSKTLELRFKTGGNYVFKLAISDPIDELDEEDLKEKMDQVIGLGIFEYKGEDLKEKLGARLITRELVDIF